MLVSLTGKHSAINLALADIELIASMLNSDNEEQAISAFLGTESGKNAAKNITSSLLKTRLKELSVLSKHFDTPPGETIADLAVNIEPSELDGFDKQQVNYLSMHHSVHVTSNGFISYAPKIQGFIKLSSEQVILLFSFAQGRAQEELLRDATFQTRSPEWLTAQIVALKNAGILVSKTILKSKNETQLSVFSTETPEATMGDLDWQSISADDRIPVYFVPHMENHFPLALGVLLNALNEYKDGLLSERFLFLPINYLEPSELINGPYRKFGNGIWLFSNYMWSIDLNMQISNAIKQHDSGNFTIHGGPSTPDYPQACAEFLNKHPSVDIAVHGEGEVTITEIFEVLNQSFKVDADLDRYKLSQVAGITYKDPISRNVVRTGSRERMKQPDAVSSPYLSGVFDNYQGRVEAAIIESNRGCPYGCTFCDWGSATNQKVRKFDLERVFDEITWIGRNQVRVLWIADANYGLYERDIDISKHIVATKQKYGYPQEVVVNYTKNSTRKLVDIIKVFSEGGIISQGIISIQTTDDKTLEVINRKNIRTERYDELSEIFAELKLPLSTDLMIGLPGITVASFKRDLQRYIDKDISVKAYPTQLLPNSPMADPEYIEKYQIEVDENSFITSTYSFTHEELIEMKGLFHVYEMAEGYGLLRYVIRFLQWEHQIQSIDFLQKLMLDIQSSPAEYPLLTWAVRFFNTEKSMPGGWLAFYREVSSYIKEQYGLVEDSALSTVLSVNAAAMPDDGLNYPYQAQLQHDFVRYFKDAKDNLQPLKSYVQAEFQVSDPNSLVDIDLNAAQYDSHQYFWELHSEVARPKSLVKMSTTASE
ncbi:hypothetical protein MACH26_12560 [Planctobacterium marinum]|uniref:Radical SAM core domain-containing protein n=2 Tax=Planctobacterium marinum TaxID=1631968 RepID=A0AA48KTT2_9ALTE|nr:hypothetical protein MACH26_12560 [Planctobacterium marinum]